MDQETRDRRVRASAGRPVLGRAARARAAPRDLGRRRALRRPAAGPQRGRPRRARPCTGPRSTRLEAHRPRRPRGTTRTTLDVLEAIASRELARIEARIDRLAVATTCGARAAARRDRVDAAGRHARAAGALRRPASRAIPALPRGHRPTRARGPPRDRPRRASSSTAPSAQVERLLATAPEDSPALAPVGDDARPPRADRREVRDVVPRLRGYLEALKDHRPPATETIGLAALPDGDRMYAAQILSWTTLPLDRAGGARARRPSVDGSRRSARQSRRARLRRPAAAIAAHPGREHRRVARGAGADRARTRSSGAGRPRRRCSAGSRRRTARSAPSRSSARPTCRSPSTTRRRPTARARASTTSTRTTPSTAAAPARQHHPPRGQPRPPLPDRDRAGDGRPAARSGGSAASSPAARSSRAGACTASGSPTRWACT